MWNPVDRLRAATPEGRQTASLVIVAVIAVAMYARSPWNGWAVDDAVIAAHPLLQSARTLPAALLSPWWYDTGHLYRPLSALVLGIQLVLAGGVPWLPHTINVGLHAAVALMVTQLCRRWLPLAPTFAAGVFFALLPAHGEGVATVVGVAELMAALALVAVMLVVTDGAPPTRARRVLVALLSMAALASKEGGVAAPVLALAAAWTIASARPHAVRWALSALAGTVVMLAARVAVLGTLGGDDPHPLFRALHGFARIEVALAMLPRNAAMLFLPVRPAINYTPSLAYAQSPSVLAVGAGLVMLALALAALVLHARRPSVWSLGVVIIAATLAPTSNLLFASGVVLSGRNLYAPSIGAALLFGALLASLSRSRVRPLVPALAGAFLVACAIVTWREVPVWRSSASVLDAAGRRDPDSYWVPKGRAYRARDAGQPREAIEHFQQASDLLPVDWEMLTDGATVALAQRDTARAERWLRSAIAAHPRAVRARVRLIAIARARGDVAEARRLIEDGLRADPEQRALAVMRLRLR